MEFPIVFHRLKTVKDDKFTDTGGLRLDLADEENVAYHAPILSNPTSNFRTEDPSLIVNGLPSTLGDGDRKLYTAESGLRALYRNGGLVFVSTTTICLTRNFKT